MNALRFSLVGVMLLLLAPLSAMAQDMPPPFGGAEDVGFANSLWVAMTAARMVGDGAIQTTTYAGGTPPHTEVLVTLQGMVTVEGERGVAVVKKNYAPGTEQAAIFADPSGGLMMITVMFQRAPGYDADNQDWFWAGYMPGGMIMQTPEGMVMAGQIAKGMETGCIACHAGAPGGDYIFLHDAIEAR